jgi:hypothetical protein
MKAAIGLAVLAASVTYGAVRGIRMRRGGHGPSARHIRPEGHPGSKPRPWKSEVPSQRPGVDRRSHIR